MKSFARPAKVSIRSSRDSPSGSPPPASESPTPPTRDEVASQTRNAEEMQKRIEQRQKELERKRKQLEELRAAVAAGGGSGDSPAVPRPSIVKADSLLSDVLAAIATAKPSEQSKLAAKTAVEAKKSPSTPIKPQLNAHLPRNLAITSIPAVEVYPPVNTHFDKSVQADFSLGEIAPDVRERKPAYSVERSRLAPMRVKTTTAFASVDMTTMEETKPTAKVAEMSEADKSATIVSPEFQKFVANASKLIERALNETEVFDVLSDFIGVSAGAGDVGDTSRVKLLGTFVDDKFSSRRPIYDLRNSPHHSELFICAYGERRDASLNDTGGAVLLWNLAVRQSPEFSFVAPSPVCTSLVSPFDPSLIIGGTYSGSVLFWDIRAKARPVLRTEISRNSHVNPIYSLELIGTKNANSLVSIDAYGRLCLWSLASMSQPNEAIDLYRPTPGATKGQSTTRDFLACLCVGIAEGETTKFLGGAEDGSIYEVSIQGSRSQVTDVYPGGTDLPGHSAPVTAVHWHPTSEKSSHIAGGSSDFGHLVITSSIDWTVKLWSSKLFGRGAEAAVPLQTFEASEDAVFDVKWSPTHPGVFASLDAEEHLDVWDLTKNVDTPSIRSPTGSLRLNCCQWSGDGRRIATADGDGKVKIWGVASELSQAKPDSIELLHERVEEMIRSTSQRR